MGALGALGHFNSHLSVFSGPYLKAPWGLGKGGPDHPEDPSWYPQVPDPIRMLQTQPKVRQQGSCVPWVSGSQVAEPQRMNECMEQVAGI